VHYAEYIRREVQN